MKRLIYLVFALAWIVPLSAQTALDSTTLAEAVDTTETRIDVTSATNAAAGELAVVDNEVMLILSVDSTNNRIVVRRGAEGTISDNHANGRLIYINPPDRYIQKDLYGTCTDGSEDPNYEPLINLKNGKRYTCTNSKWALVEVNEYVFGDSEARDQALYWDGNAQDFYMALDDSADDLVIGVGTTVGTTPALSVDENSVTTFNGGSILLTETVAAANTLTASECGKVMFLSSATEFASTLPAPSAGCYFKFVVAAAPSGASYTIVTNASANILIGGINELEVDTNDDGPYDNNGDTITFVDAVSVVGDWVEMVSDGTSWYLTGQTNADGGATITGS